MFLLPPRKQGRGRISGNLLPAGSHLRQPTYRLPRTRSARMTATAPNVVCDISADPFGERFFRHLSVHKQLLGGSFHFESASEALLDLVEAAYGDLPSHRLPVAAPDFRIELHRVPHRDQPYIIEPPQVRMHSGAGVLCGVIDASNYVVISPAQHRALVVASEDMLDFPYHLRYELIEFAVFILATRGLGLVPLHGACVGRNGHGLLLLGASGAGKSTLALHSLLSGLDFLSEDAVFVQPETLLATGVANYVHVKSDALGFIEHDVARQWIGGAPVIRRRSGVEKFEADLRHGHGRIAASPLKLVGAVFVTSEQAIHPDALLRCVPKDDIAARLHADQPYAAGQPGWLHFQQKMAQMDVHELRRWQHPRASVEALMQLLDRS